MQIIINGPCQRTTTTNHFQSVDHKHCCSVSQRCSMRKINTTRCNLNSPTEEDAEFRDAIFYFILGMFESHRKTLAKRYMLKYQTNMQQKMVYGYARTGLITGFRNMIAAYELFVDSIELLEPITSSIQIIQLHWEKKRTFVVALLCWNTGLE